MIIMCAIYLNRRKINKLVVCLTGGEIVLYFLQVAALGPLWGYVMAKVTLFCLSRVFNDALIEITITLASTYMTYYIGKLLPFDIFKLF
jgi:NhaP-type Na+/H+ or K+/H+ antiporter